MSYAGPLTALERLAADPLDAEENETFSSSQGTVQGVAHLGEEGLMKVATSIRHASLLIRCFSQWKKACRRHSQLRPLVRSWINEVSMKKKFGHSQRSLVLRRTIKQWRSWVEGRRMRHSAQSLCRQTLLRLGLWTWQEFLVRRRRKSVMIQTAEAAQSRRDQRLKRRIFETWIADIRQQSNLWPIAVQFQRALSRRRTKAMFAVWRNAIAGVWNRRQLFQTKFAPRWVLRQAWSQWKLVVEVEEQAKLKLCQIAEQRLVEHVFHLWFRCAQNALLLNSWTDYTLRRKQRQLFGAWKEAAKERSLYRFAKTKLKQKNPLLRVKRSIFSQWHRLALASQHFRLSCKRRFVAHLRQSIEAKKRLGYHESHFTKSLFFQKWRRAFEKTRSAILRKSWTRWKATWRAHESERSFRAVSAALYQFSIFCAWRDIVRDGALFRKASRFFRITQLQRSLSIPNVLVRTSESLFQLLLKRGRVGAPKLRMGVVFSKNNAAVSRTAAVPTQSNRLPVHGWWLFVRMRKYVQHLQNSADQAFKRKHCRDAVQFWRWWATKRHTTRMIETRVCRKR